MTTYRVGDGTYSDHTCATDHDAFTRGIDTTCPACVHDHAVSLVEEEAAPTIEDAIEAIRYEASR